MSLRGFHIVFVTVCTLLSLFLALWGFFFAPDEFTFGLGLGIAGVIGILLMPVYGVYFVRKASKLHL